MIQSTAARDFARLWPCPSQGDFFSVLLGRHIELYSAVDEIIEYVKQEQEMADSQGFWSYVHADDEAEGERISQLARDVTEQYRMLTGEQLVLFLDKDALNWGDAWRDKIDSSLASVAFLYRS